MVCICMTFSWWWNPNVNHVKSTGSVRLWNSTTPFLTVKNMAYSFLHFECSFLMWNLKGFYKFFWNWFCVCFVLCLGRNSQTHYKVLGNRTGVRMAIFSSFWRIECWISCFHTTFWSSTRPLDKIFTLCPLGRFRLLPAVHESASVNLCALCFPSSHRLSSSLPSPIHFFSLFKYFSLPSSLYVMIKIKQGKTFERNGERRIF